MTSLVALLGVVKQREDAHTHSPLSPEVLRRYTTPWPTPLHSKILFFKRLEINFKNVSEDEPRTLELNYMQMQRESFKYMDKTLF